MADQAIVIAKLDRVQLALDALTRGLGQIGETLRVHGEMLGHLLEAATQPPPSEGDLSKVLAALARAVMENTEALGRFESDIRALPEAIARAVLDGEV